MLLALVAGAAALVGGSGLSREDGGDDEVAAPDDRDLQDPDTSPETAPPTVHCVRDDAPVACVRWIRHPAAEGPDATTRSGSRVRVTAERIVTVVHDTVRALSRESGELQWQRVFDGPVETWHLVDDVVVLLASDGRTHALSTDDGTQLWSADEVGPITPRRGGDGVVHVIALHGDRSILTARDPDDGSVQWEYELPEREGERGFFGPEVTQAGSLTMLTTDARQHVDLVALDREDGTERWRRRNSRAIHASHGIAIVMEIERVIEEEGEDTLSISDSPRALVGLDAADGTERWRYPLPENHPPIELVDDDVLVIADDRDTTALDIATGEERWRVSGQGDGHLVSTVSWWWEGRYESRLNGMVLSVVPGDSLVVARDAGTGELRWRTQLDRLVGHVTTVDGTVMVSTTENSHVLLDLASGTPLGTVTAEMFGPPMFVAADLLVDQRSGWLVALDLPPQ